jgi:hypothetical protein
MKQSICHIKGCRNEGRYCRLHIGYTVPELKLVNKISDNQKEILAEYKKVRAVFLTAHPFCAAKLEGCKIKATEIHHKAGKASNELYLDTSLFLEVCSSCHRIIEKNPAFAKQNGFSVSRLSKTK